MEQSTRAYDWLISNNKNGLRGNDFVVGAQGDNNKKTITIATTYRVSGDDFVVGAQPKAVDTVAEVESGTG